MDDSSESTTLKNESSPLLLTERQRDVVTLLAQGFALQEAADRLQLSLRTVKAHKGRIMHRLGLRNTVELCRYAIREGLITP